MPSGKDSFEPPGEPVPEAEYSQEHTADDKYHQQVTCHLMCCKGIKAFIDRQLPVPGYLNRIACNTGGQKTSLIRNYKRGIVPVNFFQFLSYLCSAFNRFRLLLRYNRRYIAILLKKLYCNPPQRVWKLNTFKNYR